MDLEAGVQIGDFVIDRRLGAGGMGVVYLGRQVSLNRPVAIKVLGPALPLAFAGAALWALGVCLIFPTAMSAAGEVPDRPTGAIAAVATVGYAGFLLGPPAIGLLADHVGLGRALLILPVLGVAIAVLAPAVRPSR